MAIAPSKLGKFVLREGNSDVDDRLARLMTANQAEFATQPVASAGNVCRIQAH